MILLQNINTNPKVVKTEQEIERMNDLKNEMNQKIVDILRPEILKLKELMQFVVQIVGVFRETIQHLVNPQARLKVVPEGLYGALIKVIDLILKLDNLKDMKASLNNDFARYKRALGALSNNPNMSMSPGMMEEQVELQNFLSNQDPRKAKQYIFLTLRDELKRIMFHEEVLTEILEQALDHMERKLYVTPDERYRNLRVLPHLLLLIDGNIDDAKGINVFRNLKKQIAILQRVFKQYPIVPLYGDMPMTIQFIIERIPHYDKLMMNSAWMDSFDKRITEAYDITLHWETIKESYNYYILHFSRMINRLQMNPFVKIHDPSNADRSREIYDIVKDGFSRICEWNCLLLQMLAWKYTHPAPHPHINKPHAKLDTPGIEYERAVRYNFSKTELSIVVDIITMIKSCASLMSREEIRLAPIMRYYVHHEIQQIVQAELLPLLHRAHKRGKTELLQALVDIRNLAADWSPGDLETIGDYRNYTRKQGRLEASHPARVVSASFTQLHLLRTQIRALYDERSAGRQKQGIFGKVDLEKDDITLLEKFYYDSYFYPYVLGYAHSVREVSDLGDLWYREFYLEISKCVQFPIEMSLPWILTEHVINYKVSVS